MKKLTSGLILIGWFYSGYIGIPMLKTALIFFIIFISLMIWRVVRNLFHLTSVIKYSGVDMIDLLKQ